ncbi:GntR family transcriptional regulator [Thalassobaculum fulvum]|uniref:GntR family transcriptional regulator n=1 Tax=Thalassobaculum fulvum TaxID=1633335 RepID=A0A919CNZ0_9PROT|nr:GntR family transcriptional regulator [Thalassobaculum fulvum]GHD44613.1 GntR family transcriptional regulator [Thalassobaculum fulvum]
MTRARPPSQTRRATALLREMIVTNRLPPGSNHLETELAELLGMSRTPVREAAIALEAQGLVEVRPRHGIRVLPVSAADMEEIYSVLTELESLAASNLARSRPPAEALTELTGLVDEMDAALDAGDRPRWAAADDAFHGTLVRLAGNRRLEAIVETMSDQVRRARLVTLFLRPEPRGSNADHRRLIEAIAAGDADAARAIHRAHRIAAKDTMIRLLATHGFAAV